MQKQKINKIMKKLLYLSLSFVFFSISLGSVEAAVVERELYKDDQFKVVGFEYLNMPFYDMFGNIYPNKSLSNFFELNDVCANLGGALLDTDLLITMDLNDGFYFYGSQNYGELSNGSLSVFTPAVGTFNFTYLCKIESCTNNGFYKDGEGNCSLVPRGYYSDGFSKRACSDHLVLGENMIWTYPQAFTNIPEDDCQKDCKEGYYDNGIDSCVIIPEKDVILNMFDEFIQLTFDQIIFEDRIYKAQTKPELIDHYLYNNDQLIKEMFSGTLPSGEAKYLLENKLFIEGGEGKFLDFYLDLRERLSVLDNADISDYLQKFSHLGYSDETYGLSDAPGKAIRIALLSKVREKIDNLKTEIGSNFLISGSAYTNGKITSTSVGIDILETERLDIFTGSHFIANNVLNFLSKEDNVEEIVKFKNLVQGYFENSIVGTHFADKFDFPLLQKIYLSEGFKINGEVLDEQGQSLFISKLDHIIVSKGVLFDYTRGVMDGDFGSSAQTIKKVIDNLELSQKTYIPNFSGSIKARLGLFDEKMMKMFIDYNTLNIIQDTIDKAGYMRGCEPGTGKIIDGEKFAFDGVDYTIPCSRVEFRKLIDDQRRKIVSSIGVAYSLYKQEVNDFIVDSFSTAYSRNAIIDSNGTTKCRQGTVDLGDGCAEVEKVKMKGIVYGSNSGPITLDPFNCSSITDEEEYEDCISQGGLRLVNEDGKVMLKGTVYSPELGHINFGGLDVNLEPGEESIDAGMEDVE